jgi:hypothetical protein
MGKTVGREKAPQKKGKQGRPITTKIKSVRTNKSFQPTNRSKIDITSLSLSLSLSHPRSVERRSCYLIMISPKKCHPLKIKKQSKQKKIKSERTNCDIAHGANRTSWKQRRVKANDAHSRHRHKWSIHLPLSSTNSLWNSSCFVSFRIGSDLID